MFLGKRHDSFSALLQAFLDIYIDLMFFFLNYHI